MARVAAYCEVRPATDVSGLYDLLVVGEDETDPFGVPVTTLDGREPDEDTQEGRWARWPAQLAGVCICVVLVAGAVALGVWLGGGGSSAGVTDVPHPTGATGSTGTSGSGSTGAGNSGAGSAATPAAGGSGSTGATGATGATGSTGGGGRWSLGRFVGEHGRGQLGRRRCGGSPRWRRRWWAGVAGLGGTGRGIVLAELAVGRGIGGLCRVRRGAPAGGGAGAGAGAGSAGSGTAGDTGTTQGSAGGAGSSSGGTVGSSVP